MLHILSCFSRIGWVQFSIWMATFIRFTYKMRQIGYRIRKTNWGTRIFEVLPRMLRKHWESTSSLYWLQCYRGLVSWRKITCFFVYIRRAILYWVGMTCIFIWLWLQNFPTLCELHLPTLFDQENFFPNLIWKLKYHMIWFYKGSFLFSDWLMHVEIVQFGRFSTQKF